MLNESMRDAITEKSNPLQSKSKKITPTKGIKRIRSGKKIFLNLYFLFRVLIYKLSILKGCLQIKIKLVELHIPKQTFGQQIRNLESELKLLQKGISWQFYFDSYPHSNIFFIFQEIFSKQTFHDFFFRLNLKFSYVDRKQKSEKGTANHIKHQC